jgi:general secretion pathway protein D
MNKRNDLRGICVLFAVLLAVAGCLAAKNRKGDKLLKEGEAAEQKQLWDEALDYYEKALATDPSDTTYLLPVKRVRFQAAQMHVNTGMKLRQDGNLEGALAEFQKAITRDPSSAIALQEWKQTSEMVEAAKAGKVPKGQIGMTPAERYRADQDNRISSMLPPPELKPITGVITSLKMNNQPPKVLYDTVGKLAGINVVFDPAYQPEGGNKNYNVDLSNSSLEQALDYLAVLTKTFWKPISQNTIFVTNDNVTKRRDYEDNVVRVFYVQNATSVQEFQEIATAVRSIAEIRRVFTYNAQHAIVMRGTPDQIALAEKLIHDLDKPKGEVVIDVIVMEVDSNKTRDLAAALMSNGQPGLNVPVIFTPRNPVLINGNGSNGSNGTNTGNGTTGNPIVNSSTGTNLSGTVTPSTGASPSYISLAQLGHVSSNDFSTTLPGALLNLVMSDRQSRVLQSPQVRASDGQKVTLRIGDKIPYASGSFQPGIGTVGVSPLVSTQFQFAEVGVNVDITPQVLSAHDVEMKIAVEISAVAQTVNIGGIDQPVIGQRKNETEIRLKDGEVNILGGLSQVQSTKSLAGVPGVTNIPILGRLLGSEHTEKVNQQLLIAVIPHIVRTANLTDTDLKGILAGTDQTVRVQYAPNAEPAAAPGTMPAPQPPATTPTQPATPAPIPGVPAVTGPAMVFLPPKVQTQVGGVINLTLQVENMADLFSVRPVRIKYDPALLRLNEVSQGEVLGRDGQRTTFTKDIRNDTGEASFDLSRLPGASGVNGNGTVATLSFTALAKGQATVTVTESALKNTQLQPITVQPASVQVNVQ